MDSFSHSVKEFLNEYMAKADKKFSYSKNEKLFRTVFETLNAALPNGINKGRKNTPLNLYEAIAIGAAKAFLNSGKINTAGVQDWITDKELIGYTTGATNSKPQVIGRIQYCQERFER